MESHKSSTSWIFSETGSCFRFSKVVSTTLFVIRMFPGSKFLKDEGGCQVLAGEGVRKRFRADRS
jgi:hypothetical protein